MASDPPVIIDLTAACRLAVRQVVGVDLDFTQDTLPLLDHYAGQTGASRDEITGLVAPMCGAYFGEVLRRTLGPAHWDIPENGEPSEYRLQFERIFLELNPLGMALEAVTKAPSQGWGSHLEVRPADRGLVTSAVDLLGDVREDDFYRFGVRYEVVEQAVQALLRKSEAPGEPTASFGPEDYARVRQGGGPWLH
jgi:hypothetical protein